MLLAAIATVAIKPTKRLADQGTKVDLELLIPKVIGEWRYEISNSVQIIDPEQQATISRIYDQTLTRTYIDSQGYRIMLSIAYGSDQRDSMQLHKPEVCYPAQGFTVLDKHVEKLSLDTFSLPITRVSTSLDQRFEPVIYWITVGNSVVTNSSVEKKLVEIRYGLKGSIPDGMLVRVSSIDNDSANAYRAQRRFISSLFNTVDATGRHRIFGEH